MSNFLSNSIIESNLGTILAQICDLGISAATGTTIPVASGLKSLYSATVEIKERYFYTKLFEFLDELKDIPQSKRIAFHAEVSKKGDNNWEEMLVLLHDLDNSNKARICGCLLKNTILGNLYYPDFKRLVYVVDRLFYDDLMYFIKTNKNIILEKTEKISIFINLGLVEPEEFLENEKNKTKLPTISEIHKGLNTYIINNLGEKLRTFSK
ncbi:hypothetical protein [Myroides odoratimimus]|uniref:hypothetical protein n=1 Tax=Myroides odoratimimus TaxID=76832 RepID=UPI0004680325|nr:hypothetical protein [Myroides odoratimimus]